MQNQQLFSNRIAVIATMHKKERVIAPLLVENLGIKPIVPQDFNTDIFGTFTREVARTGTQIAAARTKAEKALEITGETLAIASEGSFAPHPSFPYIYSNREIVILLDKENDIEIIGEEFSLDTNFNHKLIANRQEALDFASQVGFPEHGLVIRLEQSSKVEEMIKGISTEEEFSEVINYAFSKSPDLKLYLETDMRALYNPTRMKNIEKATYDLLRKTNSYCPNCSIPGWTISEAIKGLPCGMCYLPTPLIRAVVYQCKKCGFSQEKLFPDDREFADPALCSYCNP